MCSVLYGFHQGRFDDVHLFCVFPVFCLLVHSVRIFPLACFLLVVLSVRTAGQAQLAGFIARWLTCPKAVTYRTAVLTRFK